MEWAVTKVDCVARRVERAVAMVVSTSSRWSGWICSSHPRPRRRSKPRRRRPSAASFVKTRKSSVSALSTPTGRASARETNRDCSPATSPATVLSVTSRSRRTPASIEGSWIRLNTVTSRRRQVPSLCRARTITASSSPSTSRARVSSSRTAGRSSGWTRSATCIPLRSSASNPSIPCGRPCEARMVPSAPINSTRSEKYAANRSTNPEPSVPGLSSEPSPGSACTRSPSVVNSVAEPPPPRATPRRPPVPARGTAKGALRSRAPQRTLAELVGIGQRAEHLPSGNGRTCVEERPSDGADGAVVASRRSGSTAAERPGRCRRSAGCTW